MNDLPTDFLIAALTRTAAREGVPIVVVRRGHDARGTIVLKINRLDGTARVLTQARYDDELIWSPVGKIDPMTDIEAEQHMQQQARFDPDAWLIEIEDRQGRLWFPGRVIG